MSESGNIKPDTAHRKISESNVKQYSPLFLYFYCISAGWVLHILHICFDIVLYKQRLDIMEVCRKLTYILHTKLAYGIVHKDCEVFHDHTDIPISPTTLVRPVLVTFILGKQQLQVHIQEAHSRAILSIKQCMYSRHWCLKLFSLSTWVFVKSQTDSEHPH